MHASPWKSGPLETGSQLFFRPAGACSYSTSHPGLAPGAAFLRRFAAQNGVAFHLCVDIRIATQALQGRVSSAPSTRALAPVVALHDIKRLFAQPLEPCPQRPKIHLSDDF